MRRAFGIANESLAEYKGETSAALDLELARANLELAQTRIQFMLAWSDSNFQQQILSLSLSIICAVLLLLQKDKPNTKRDCAQSSTHNQ